ncbi:pentatricopeptide repeat-containing protein [Tanacetum coccineum]
MGCLTVTVKKGVDYAFELLAMMEKRNSRPNIQTYNELMKGLCRIRKPYKATALLRKIIDNGLHPERLTYNILINGFCKEGQLVIACRIIKSIDLITNLTDLLNPKERKLDQANGLLSVMMKKGIKLNEVTFTALINGYCKNGKIGNAVRVLDTIVRAKITIFNLHILACFDDDKHDDFKLSVLLEESKAYSLFLKLPHSKAQNRALLAQIETLETHMSRMDWQRQRGEDDTVRQIMHTHVLEARAHIENGGTAC